MRRLKRGAGRSASCAPGSASRAVSRCVRKDRLTSRTAAPTWRWSSATAPARSPARAFRDADRIGLRFEAGDAIAVAGKLERFRGELVAEIEDVRKLEPGSFDPAEFLPAAYRSVEELEGFLEHLTARGPR